MSGTAQITEGIEATEVRPDPPARFVKRAAVFILVGLALYSILYAGAEYLVYQYANKNRFSMVKFAPMANYDYVIVGASHAMPFDFGDMNDRLQQASGGSVINLSIEGGGIVPNRLLLEYFFAKRRARIVVVFLDSFAFYTPKWNEERINDAKLFHRAPLDLDLVRVLARYPSARPILLNYVSGFLKINNENRFTPDLSEAELTRFGRTYRPVAQIDRQRVAYLYPPVIDPVVLSRYLREFEALVELARGHGAKVVVVKPPTPRRYRDRLPNEAAFDAAVGSLLAAKAVPYHDLSTALADDRYYYDTDHLNRNGVAALIDGQLGDILRQNR